MRRAAVLPRPRERDLGGGEILRSIDRKVSGFAAVLLAGLAVAILLPGLGGPAVTEGQTGEGGDPGIVVFLDRPDPFSPAFGDMEMEAVVQSPVPLVRVVFYVDGIVYGELREPPWQMTVSVGSANAEHTFEVVAHGEGGLTGSASTTTPAIRVDEEVSVTLQQLYVTATRDGVRVPDLTPEDFEILDEGQPQTLVTFARGDIPFTSIVLLDSSVSMKGAKLRAAVQGASAFFHGMQPLDESKLLVFSDRVLHTTPFTTFPEVLTTGLGRVEARGGTAAADHLYLALQQIEARQGRRVVVLLSDGVDSHSVLSMADVVAAARRSQALIYWLRLPYRRGAADEGGEMPLLRSSWRSSEEYADELGRLRQAVVESAGRIQPLATIDDIEPAFRGILEELRDQYVLGYYPTVSRHDATWRRVRVRVRRPGIEVRSQSGYVDF